MTRSVTFDIPADTSLFTPLQLHPRAGFWLAMTAWARWLRTHWLPFPRLIREQQLGVVIAGLDLEYLQPFGFFDSEALVVSAAVTARADGRLLFQEMSIETEAGSPVARVTAILRPVHIADGIALSATPVSLDAGTLERFMPDGVVPVEPVQRLRTIAADVEQASSPIAVQSRTFTLHRHLCEAADQWSGIALADIATEVREELVSTHLERHPELAAAFTQPLRRVTLEFQRAAFFLDEFVVECHAYERDGEYTFIHRLSTGSDGDALALFVEWIPAAPTAARREQEQLVRQGGGR